MQTTPQFAIRASGQTGSSPDLGIRQILRRLECLNELSDLERVLVIGRATNYRVGVPPILPAAHQADQVGAPLGRQDQAGIRVALLVCDHKAVSRSVQYFRLGSDWNHARSALQEIF